MTLTGPAPGIDRDRWGRPLVTPPGGGKPVGYTRATTFAGTLEDTYNLGKWQQRMTAIGLSQRPDLMLAVAAHNEDKTKMDEVCESALEAAKASSAATIGTALHALCERMDRDLDLGVVPTAYIADLAAYKEATADLVPLQIESFTVVDDLQVGGTPDRVVVLPDGRVVIADIKTGSIEWGIGKIALQLALYAHGELYDIATGERSDLGPVDPDIAVIIHLPAGQGYCELVEVDIAAGWAATPLVKQVRDWRKRKNLTRKMATVVPKPLTLVPSPNLGGHDGTQRHVGGDRAEVEANEPGMDPIRVAENIRTEPIPPVDSLANMIASAASNAELLRLWEEHQHLWKPRYTELAVARKALLAEVSA